MPNKAAYCAILKQKPETEWTAYLLSESGLPGPRGNLELAQAAADCAGREQFLAWLAMSSGQTDSNLPDTFLAVCGTVGLGRLAAEGDAQQTARLRELSNDPRWRVREGTAMALQRLGMVNMPLLLQIGLWNGLRPACWRPGRRLRRSASRFYCAIRSILRLSSRS